MPAFRVDNGGGADPGRRLRDHLRPGEIQILDSKRIEVQRSVQEWQQMASPSDGEPEKVVLGLDQR